MRFFEITDNSIVGRIVNGRASVLKDIDPDRIYVEKIRAFFGLSFPVAKFFCEMAVKQGFFTKHIGVECPNEGRLIKTFASGAELPEVIECLNCEVAGNERYVFETQDCAKVEFYKLVRR
jgi:hypothetical protein